MESLFTVLNHNVLHSLDFFLERKIVIRESNNRFSVFFIMSGIPLTTDYGEELNSIICISHIASIYPHLCIFVCIIYLICVSI